MTSTPIRLALIGVGGYGRYHLEMIRQLVRENLVELIAVADHFLGEMPEVRFTLMTAGIRCYADYRLLLAGEPDLDLVTVVSPIPLHETMVQDVLACGHRIYLEKPPVPTIQQLLSLIRLDAHEKVTVGFQMLRYPQVLRLKEWMVSGALGDVLSMTATACWPRSTGYYQRATWAGKLLLDGVPVFDGPSSNGLAHLIQLIVFLGGEEGRFCAVPDWVEGEFYRVRPIEGYDLAAIAGAFPNQIKFTTLLAHCGSEAEPFRIRIKGTRGGAWLSHDGTILGNDLDLNAETSWESSPMAGLHLYRDLLRAIILDEPPVISLRDCLGYAKTVCGGLISSGGIHTVGTAEIVTVGEGDDTYYQLRGLSNVMENASRHQKLPSQQNLTWAVPARRTMTTDIDHIELGPFS
jgi:predicted dehydrogenase